MRNHNQHKPMRIYIMITLMTTEHLVEQAVEANKAKYIENYKLRLLWLKRDDAESKRNETKYFYVCLTITETLQNLFPEFKSRIQDKFLDIELELDREEYLRTK